MKIDHLQVQLESLHLCPQLLFQILLAARQSLWLPPMSETHLSVHQTQRCLLLAVADQRLGRLKQLVGIPVQEKYPASETSISL